MQTDLNKNCARAGWGWGAAGFDLENDGDDDLYVANGHISGESARDYCTNFWRHDLYTGSSGEDPAIERLLTDRFRPPPLRGLQAGRISWNGYEHNRLFLNHEGRDFLEIGFLLGVAYERDCRSVAAADLDADGRQDLLVVDHRWSRVGEITGVQSLLMHRNTAPSGHWLGVRLAGSRGVSPIGAKVVVHGTFGTRERQVVTGDSFYTQHPAVAHFGLGPHQRFEKVEVRWPGGSVSEHPGGAADRYLLLRPSGN
ncbi:MAG: CRTAC1 family protein [Akkermansiaceae bacterium]|nr:CRTAC1 family protein [Akkermansiaceae bacterium]